MATYIVALVVAVLVVRAVDLGHPLAELALGTLVATVVVFAVSVAADNSSIYDPYWSVQPAGHRRVLPVDRLGRRCDARQIIVTGARVPLRAAAHQQLLPGLAGAGARRTSATVVPGRASAGPTGR